MSPASAAQANCRSTSGNWRARLGARVAAARRPAQSAAMSAAMRPRAPLTIWLWVAVALSLLGWIIAGYPWLICVIAVLPLLAPLHGLRARTAPHLRLGDTVRGALSGVCI